MSDTQTKRRTEPLLETDAYSTTPVERLRAERLTINNRLSGLATQIKRAAAAKDTGKAAELEERRTGLQARRDALAEQIAARTDDLVEATGAGARRAAAAVEVPELDSERPTVTRKADRRKGAQAALELAGIGDIAEDSYALLEAAHGFPTGASAAAIAELAGDTGKPAAITARLKALERKNVIRHDKTTATWLPMVVAKT